MTQETFGWAIVNRNGAIILPVVSVRAVAIGELVTSFDAGLTRHVGSSLTADQYAAWRRLKYLGLRCIRVKVDPAFEGAP